MAPKPRVASWLRSCNKSSISTCVPTRLSVDGVHDLPPQYVVEIGDAEQLLADEHRLLPLFHPTDRTVLGRGVRALDVANLLVRPALYAMVWKEG